jgi:hypothetical protein
MKRLLTILCIPAALLLLSSTEGWSLPACGSPESTWTNCFGTATYANGNKYVGGWKDGRLHGQGTETHADGLKYVGEFKNGKLHGYGVLTAPYGRVIRKGTWVYDEFLGDR